MVKDGLLVAEFRGSRRVRFHRSDYGASLLRLIDRRRNADE